MNNQVKLIDQNKVDAYIEQRQRSGDGSEELWMLQQEMRAGTFDPDTPLVPTIKPGDKEYVCCECKEPSSSNEWNIATLKVYGSDIYLIEDDNKAITTLFVCPKCGSDVDFDCLEVSHD